MRTAKRWVGVRVAGHGACEWQVKKAGRGRPVWARQAAWLPPVLLPRLWVWQCVRSHSVHVCWQHATTRADATCYRSYCTLRGPSYFLITHRLSPKLYQNLRTVDKNDHPRNNAVLPTSYVLYGQAGSQAAISATLRGRGSPEVPQLAVRAQLPAILPAFNRDSLATGDRGGGGGAGRRRCGRRDCRLNYPLLNESRVITNGLMRGRRASARPCPRFVFRPHILFLHSSRSNRYNEAVTRS